MASQKLNFSAKSFSSLLIALITATVTGIAGERAFVQIRDFEQTEVKSAGFTLPRDMSIHIVALGGGAEKGMKFSADQMFAYGWIIDANTRESVWKMDRNNTSREKDDRKFDGTVSLKKGSYEIYFSAYAFASHSPFGSFNFNIDRRRDDRSSVTIGKKRGFLSWFEELFGGDSERDWKRRSKNWGIDLSVSDREPEILMFNPPKEFPGTVYKSVRLGENEHIRQSFALSKPASLRVYALGEAGTGDELVDYGWIVSEKTHRRIWEMKTENVRSAGSAEKDVKFDETVSLPAGGFILYFITDDSHSFVDWNAAPPDDPFNYGITLIAGNEADKPAFKLSAPKEEQNVIVQLTRLGNDENRSASFTLKSESRLHVYAIGERGNSRRQMADYGWIINAITREKVWTMDVDKTEIGGGADKNRMIDEDITLPKGTYTVFFQTDDSHAYDDWNAAIPFDPEHWGITISGEGSGFSLANVEKNVTPKESGVLAQIIRVGDNANRTETFTLDKPTRVRVYALGEGQNHDMSDYGWIEDASRGGVVWEMTYSMTFHAG